MNLKNVSGIFTALGVATLFNVVGIANKAEAANFIELIGLTNDNKIISFDANKPDQIKTTAVTGVTGNLVGLDFRSANGDLFGVTDNNQIYTVDPTTGVGSLVSNSPTPFTLSGTSFAVDFNPTPDRIRVVSNTGQNLRLNPNTGGIALNPNTTPAVDTPLSYDSSDPNSSATPDIVAQAYTNSVAPSPDPTRRTTLYGIDRDLDILVTQGSENFLAGDPAPAVSPNSGRLFTVGSLGVDFGDGGFDILNFNGQQNLAYAASGANLYSINLSTGAATSIGTIGDGSVNLIGLSARSIPEPTTVVSLSGLGAFALFKVFGRQRKLSR